MDLGRVAIAAVLASAGCRGAAAAPDVHGAAFTPPAGWVALPRVAAAARAAMGAAHDPHAAAWGDPAAGCYVVITSTRGDDEDRGDARAALVAGLGLPGAGGGNADRLDGELHVPGVTGKARAWATPVGDGVVSTAAACVFNAREPIACAAACDAVWASLVAPPVIP
jgi:hypothetical protein